MVAKVLARYRPDENDVNDPAAMPNAKELDDHPKCFESTKAPNKAAPSNELEHQESTLLKVTHPNDTVANDCNIKPAERAESATSFTISLHS